MRKIKPAIAIIIFGFLIGCDKFHNDSKLMKEKAMVVSPKFFELLDSVKHVCFGRFVVEIPIASEVVYGPADVPLSIERLAGKAKEIGPIIANRLIEIEKDRYRAFGELKHKDSMLGKVIDGRQPNQKILFGIRPGAGDYYRIESYLILGDDIFVYKANPSGDKKDYEEALEKINALSGLVSSRPIGEMPTAAGVCVDGGFVEDSVLLKHENITLGIRLIDFPDVHISISTTKKEFLVESDALEPRLRIAEQDAKNSGFGSWYSSIKFLRRGHVSIDKWEGFEILARKPAQANELESHEFAFLSQGEPKNSYLPVLDIKLHSGIANNKVGQVKPSITDDEALLLWEKITKSIRVRPVNSEASLDVKGAHAIGKMVFSGQLCPQTGWWDCAHGGVGADVVGGTRQHFQKGSVMPQAVLLGIASRRDRFKPEPSIHVPEHATVWTLVGLYQGERGEEIPTHK